MAIPDSLTFAGADQATLNPCARQKLSECPDFSLALWKVAAD
jgi:hypothetical protein